MIFINAGGEPTLPLKAYGTVSCVMPFFVMFYTVLTSVVSLWCR